ncbi:50S ribosomal protein L11 [Patescibacteria group bacterium]|nr:50S ribosomal protein L11 [Candidatus Dojkabacteria bacterium]CAG1022631.1 50S ribosomal protein L11 [Patescibacteria group bacterium]
MAKEIVSVLKLELPAGKANPAPPIGPIIGQAGIPIQPFLTEFNAKTAAMGNDIIPIIVQIFKDRSYKIIYKQPTISGMLKSKLKLEKGSATPNKSKVAKIKRADLAEIAERKLPDLNTKKKSSAVKIVEGVARSLGIDVID